MMIKKNSMRCIVGFFFIFIRDMPFVMSMQSRIVSSGYFGQECKNTEML